MKKKRLPNKATKAEEAYIRDIARRSPFDLLDQGLAEIVKPEDYPEPLRRLVMRENRVIHVKLSAASRKALDAKSRRTGVPADELARRWIEQHLRRTGS